MYHMCTTLYNVIRELREEVEDETNKKGCPRENNKVDERIRKAYAIHNKGMLFTSTLFFLLFLIFVGTFFYAPNIKHDVTLYYINLALIFMYAYSFLACLYMFRESSKSGAELEKHCRGQDPSEVAESIKKAYEIYNRGIIFTAVVFLLLFIAFTGLIFNVSNLKYDIRLYYMNLTLISLYTVGFFACFFVVLRRPNGI